MEHEPTTPFVPQGVPPKGSRRDARHPKCRRVIKLGGSLLEYGDLVGELRRWLAAQSPAQNLLVVGGGAMADAVRRADRLHGLGETAAHWLCVRAMGVNSRLIAALLPEADYVTSLDELNGAEQRTDWAHRRPVAFLARGGTSQRRHAAAAVVGRDQRLDRGACGRGLARRGIGAVEIGAARFGQAFAAASARATSIGIFRSSPKGIPNPLRQSARASFPEVTLGVAARARVEGGAGQAASAAFVRRSSFRVRACSAIAQSHHQRLPPRAIAFSRTGARESLFSFLSAMPQE